MENRWTLTSKLADGTKNTPIRFFQDIDAQASQVRPKLRLGTQNYFVTKKYAATTLLETVFNLMADTD